MEQNRPTTMISQQRRSCPRGRGLPSLSSHQADPGQSLARKPQKSPSKWISGARVSQSRGAHAQNLCRCRRTLKGAPSVCSSSPLEADNGGEWNYLHPGTKAIHREMVSSADLALRRGAKERVSCPPKMQIYLDPG